MTVPAGPARRMWVALILLILAGAAAPACEPEPARIAIFHLHRGHRHRPRRIGIVDIGDEGYAAQGSGRASGFLRILVSGQAQLASRADG